MPSERAMIARSFVSKKIYQVHISFSFLTDPSPMSVKRFKQILECVGTISSNSILTIGKHDVNTQITHVFHTKLQMLTVLEVDLNVGTRVSWAPTGVFNWGISLLCWTDSPRSSNDALTKIEDARSWRFVLLVLEWCPRDRFFGKDSNSQRLWYSSTQNTTFLPFRDAIVKRPPR